MPWKESLKQVRKANCFTPVASTVTSSAVAEPDTTGILFCSATGMVAFMPPEVAGPITVMTLSCVISLVASVVASAASDLVSYLTSSICLPSMPPALLISSAAISMPWTFASP